MPEHYFTALLAIQSLDADAGFVDHAAHSYDFLLVIRGKTTVTYGQ
jgi:hypothetical protein